MTLNQYNLKKHYAIGSRSNILNSLDTFNETYYEISYFNTGMGIPNGDLCPYYAVILAIDPETVFVTRTNMVLV
jgi:hypothetical protein